MNIKFPVKIMGYENYDLNGWYKKSFAMKEMNNLTKNIDKENFAKIKKDRQKRTLYSLAFTSKV
jgi:hypothetical protein